MKPSYTDSFFDEVGAFALASAKVVAPYVYGLVRPNSVVDIGCGTGAWLKVFSELGVAQVQGYDGSAQPQNLNIPLSQYQQFDFASGQIPTEKKFDLAICLEVAEHLDEAGGVNLISGLTEIAPMILFSAAIPGQGGHHHIHEQWPNYWRTFFEAKGFVAFDLIRARYWTDLRVAYWYSQNTIFYVSKKKLESSPGLKEQLEAESASVILDMVHPEMLEAMLREQRAKAKPWNAFRHFLSRLTSHT